MIDLLTLDDLLDPAFHAELLAELRASAGSASTVLGDGPGAGVQSLVRRSTRVEISAATRERVLRLLDEQRPKLEAHFGTKLGECEEPQFLRYLPGDYFVAHQDGNTPLVHDRSRHRRVSMVVFLSRPSAEEAPESYGGGELVFHGDWTDPGLRVPVAPPPGTAVAFRSETTHEVTPVTHGERYTIAAFYHAR